MLDPFGKDWHLFGAVTAHVTVVVPRWLQGDAKRVQHSMRRMSLVGVLLLQGAVAEAQDAKPLPDVVALMHAVEAQERMSEAKEKEYLYHETQKMEELNKEGGVKKTELKEYDVFWVEGVVVQRLTKEDGRELDEGQKKKAAEAMEKDVAKAKERKAKADAAGRVTDANGEEEITVSRMLELGSFGNARREEVKGRDTILVDFTGDPKAKTRNAGENAMKEMGGTVWVDEADRAIEHIEGRFLNDFKVGGGLVVNVKKGTSFSLTQQKVNDEVWLPEEIDGDGQARLFLFLHLNGRLRIHDGDYRRFKATSTILPGVTETGPEVPGEPKQ